MNFEIYMGKIYDHNTIKTSVLLTVPVSSCPMCADIRVTNLTSENPNLQVKE